MDVRPMEKDWRLTNQEKYLKDKRLIRAAFVPTPQWDHEHCAFCWEKFGEYWQHTGYCTLDRYYWICDQCFHDIQADCHWVVDAEAAGGGSETRDK